MEDQLTIQLKNKQTLSHFRVLHGAELLSSPHYEADMILIHQRVKQSLRIASLTMENWTCQLCSLF